MALSQLFLDDFNRTDSTTVGNGWSQGGTFAAGDGIYSNTFRVIRSSTSGSETLGIWRDTAYPYTRAVEVTMTATPNNFQLDMVRGVTTSPHLNTGKYGYYVLVSIFAGTATIYRLTNGTGTSLASGAITVTAGTTYRLEHDDDGSLRVYANGTLALSASDTTYMTAADTLDYGVGLVVGVSNSTTTRNDGRFDDFTVYEITYTTSYTVTYEEQGGSTVTDYSGAGTFTTPSSTRTGYRLDRWNTAADGSGTDYTVGGTYDLTADLTLYAIWVAVYTVTFDEQVGSAVDDVTYDTFYPPLSYRELWILDAWNTATDGSGTRYELATSYSLTANLTLYAQWRQRGKVGIYLGGTTGGTDGTLKVPGDSATLTIGNIDDTETFHLRCATGWSAVVTVPAPPHCRVSLDGTTYAASVTATVGATNVAITVKRTEPSPAMNTGLVTLPRIHAVLARSVV